MTKIRKFCVARFVFAESGLVSIFVYRMRTKSLGARSEMTAFFFPGERGHWSSDQLEKSIERWRAWFFQNASGEGGIMECGLQHRPYSLSRIMQLEIGHFPYTFCRA